MAENSFDRIHVIGILFLLVSCTYQVEDTSWIPAGYTAFNSDVAWKWSADGSYTCSYRSCSQIEVVSKNGCDNLYAEASLLDRSKNNVGYTNATTSSLQPMQKALLMFESDNGIYNTIQLSKISCY
jgi:hypothetical protein